MPTQATYRHKIRPVNILSSIASSSTQFRFNENNLVSVLGNTAVANKKVVVISVAGAYRGKSLLLNFLLEYLYSLHSVQQGEKELNWMAEERMANAIRWRSDAKRDAIGVWMWGEPVMIEVCGEAMAVVLMDTQGTFDDSTTYRQCTTMFALSTMLSSMLIYNVFDGIHEETLQNLSLFIEYGRLALREACQFGKPFQSLTFVVRDFKQSNTLEQDYAFGEEGGREFLLTVLSADKGEEELRTVREQIRDCFEQIDCFLLPGSRLAERHSFKGNVKDLRPLFKEEIKKMIPTLLNPDKMQAKIVNGKAITCRKFVDIFREYARIFDGAELPEARSILKANAGLIYIEAANEAMIVYVKAMDRFCAGGGIQTEKRLLETHIKAGILALNVFENSPVIGCMEVRKKHLERLQEDINAEFERYKRQNADKRVTGLATALTACGDSPALGLGLGAISAGAIAGAVFTLQLGIVSAGIVAIPVSCTTLLGIWLYVTLKPKVLNCLDKKSIGR